METSKVEICQLASVAYRYTMRFKEFVNESVYYHGTTPETAHLILQNGIDVSKYKSGMFQGFYLAPDLSYFTNPNPRRSVILACDVDESKLMDVKSITDKDLEEAYPGFKRMSYAYHNHLITQIAKKRGYYGLHNGHEIIILDPKAVRSINVVSASAASHQA